MSELMDELLNDNTADLRSKRAILRRVLRIDIELELDADRESAKACAVAVDQAVEGVVRQTLAAHGVRHLFTAKWKIESEGG